MFYLLSLLSLALSASATSILLPLYVYPGTDAKSWTAVYRAITAYPNVKWQIIVNPHSGPGTNSSAPFPSVDYVTGIKTLNKISNVKMLGYVDTAWGNRNITDVGEDIDRYVSWGDYGGGDIRLDGIFFDDVPSYYDLTHNPGTDLPNETYFRTITSYARSAINTDDTPIVCNPGNPSDAILFQFCNTMVEYESTYSAFNTKTITSLTGDGAKLNQTAVVMYSAPHSLTQAALNGTIRTLQTNNVQLVGLTNDCCYNALNETLLTMLAAACNDIDVAINAAAFISLEMKTVLLQMVGVLFWTFVL